MPRVATRPAAGGGKWVEVEPERLEGWLARFGERHGAARMSATPESVTLEAADGALAEVVVPYPPLLVKESGAYAGLIEHALRSRRIGVLLVRLGGHAVGVVEGDRLVASKTGSRQVHGRSAAGGWSQQRFARRREGQVRVALQAAADAAVAVLLPAAPTLDGLVLGGDRRATSEVLDDPRLAPLRPLRTGRHLDVPEPRQRVLENAVRDLRLVQVRVVEPSADG